MADQLSQMECSIETIINIFHQYSIRLGHYDTLVKRELKQLITKELPNCIQVWEAPLLAVSHPLALRAVVEG